MSTFGNYEEMAIQGKTVELPPADPIPDEPYFVREDLEEQTLAAWSVVDGSAPLPFRLHGPPGTGKNVHVYHLARSLGKDVYVMSGDDDTRVEDIACIPSLDDADTRRIKFRASPLFSAMLRGQICFFDEIAKAPSGALAALAPVLDSRRMLESKTAGIKIRAAKGFLFCAALNENEEVAGVLPEYIAERLLPAIYVGYPSVDVLKTILMNNNSKCDDLWVECFISQFKNNHLSPRSAIKLLDFAVKLYRNKEGKGNSGRLTKSTVKRYLKKAAAGFPIEVQDKAPGPKRETVKEMAQNVYDFTHKYRKDSLH